MVFYFFITPGAELFLSMHQTNKSVKWLLPNLILKVWFIEFYFKLKLLATQAILINQFAFSYLFQPYEN